MRTQRVINFDKIQWTDYWWINGKGDTRPTKPTIATYNNEPVPARAKAFPSLPNNPDETFVERLTRMNMLDVWKPVCRIHISANRCLTYTGEEATKIWRAYNAHIYGK